MTLNQKREIQEAISWYNRVIGFHIEGGHGNQNDYAKQIFLVFQDFPLLLGVKFTLCDIDIKSPNEEYSFIIRYTNYTYTCKYNFPDFKIFYFNIRYSQYMCI